MQIKEIVISVQFYSNNKYPYFIDFYPIYVCIFLKRSNRILLQEVEAGVKQWT
jgi:hypothetical protein